VKPTYVGIGAQKCASTWVHRILEAHPEICVGSDKEIDFFSLYFDRGYQWYERQFAGCQHALAAGEISPSYFYDSAAPQRLSSYAPKIKIILCLRDPVQRALSNHRHEVRVGHLEGPDFSFEAGLANNPMYVEQGLYATHLKRWLQYFSREQILIILTEDIEDRPSEVAQKVYRFVGVDPGYQSGIIAGRFNRSYANRSGWLLAIKDWFYKRTRAPSLSWLWTAGKALGLKNMYRRINQVPSEHFIPPPSAESLARLRRIFAPEMMELEKILGRSLESWQI
jgi:hypothetical protein